MRIPLHIKQTDLSPDALHRRYELHVTMARMNPNGFRTPAGGKPSHRKRARKAWADNSRAAELACLLGYDTA